MTGAESKFQPPPGRYVTSWVGNSFAGDGGPNGQGYWVQNGATKIDVSQDGTVFAGIDWDEAGRCAGLYRDGKVNRNLLKEHDGRGRETAWGWGTGNTALAISGDTLYIANTGKKLERFHWTPGDIESAKFIDEVDLPAKALGLSARGDTIAVLFDKKVEWRRASDLQVTGSFRLSGATDVALADNGSLWVIVDGKVRQFSDSGKPLGEALNGVEKPSAISIAHEDPRRMIICDNGPDQQVKIFDVSAAPRLVATFGDRGGLASGEPGAVTPKKLFGLRGARTDKRGNLYVAMSFAGGPVGNLHLRSFTPGGDPRWQLYNAAFVDTFGFDPDADGQTIFSRDSVFQLDLSQTKPGAESALRALTVDPVHNPRDPRLAGGSTAYIRNLQGHRVLYTIGQYAGGYNIFTFGESNGWIANRADRIHGDDKWAWHVADIGDIWHGDADGRTIRRYPFKGWSEGGKPNYDWSKPQTWPWPSDFELVRRIIYNAKSDSLYLFGYLKGQRIESWGVVGFTGRRYDGWLANKKVERWTKRNLPVNPTGSEQGRPLSASAVALAGDYLFVGMVKPDDGKQHTHILAADDGTYVGTFTPGPEVGGSAGWQDMPYSVQALKRSTGEYLILAEEDWRGKNLLYRWWPTSGSRNLDNKQESQ